MSRLVHESLLSFAHLSIFLLGSLTYTAIYAAAQYQPTLTIEVPALGNYVGAIAFSPDGNAILTGGNELALWDVRTGNCLRKYPDDGVSRSILFSPDGRTVAAAYPVQYSADVCVKLWDVTRGEVIFRLCYSMSEIPYGNNWLAMAFSPDGNTLLTGDNEGVLIAWATETGKEIRRLELPTICLSKLDFLPSGSHVIVSDQSGGISLYDLETAEIRYTLRGMFTSVSRDRTRSLFNGDGSIRLHDAATGDLIRSIPSEIVPIKQSVALSPDGNLAIVDAASGAEEKYPLKVLDMNTGEVLRTYPIGSGGLRGFSPDGRYFLKVIDNRLLLYDISDLQAAVKEPSVENQEK
ncbi:MAG TPA: hypothetical protein PLG59_09120 [bacterium]|nr:hypothetical protein [bacterium]